MSAANAQERPLRPGLPTQYTLDRDLLEFYTDRRARGLAARTLKWYEQSLTIFREFLRTTGIARTEDVNASTVRAFVLFLQERGHSPGGVRNIWGAVKSFLTWYKDEYAPDWPHPMARVKAPKVPEVRLDPIPLADVKAMLDTCKGKGFTDTRDAALILALLDTAARASEFLAVNLNDVDLVEGVIMLRQTKGKCIRAVFLGQQARRAISRYLRKRGDLASDAPLWITNEGHRLKASGLRQILRRRGKQAGLSHEWGAHAFRRAACLALLRNGADVFTVQALAGHQDLATTRHYLKMLTEDLQAEHAAHSPADRLLGR